MVLTEVRFHGRAGQGIVTAAVLLAVAAGREGKYSKAFPFFGSEKRGPPLASFCRVNDKPIHLYEQIYEPDIVVVTDRTVIESAKVELGLKDGGLLIVNTERPVSQLGLKIKNILAVDGTALAVKHFGKPIVNTILLGALAKRTHLVTLDSLHDALKQHFPPEMAEKNYAAIAACYEATPSE